jgi:cobalt/nickel transport system permease protein
VTRAEPKPVTVVGLVVAGLAIAIALAFFASPHASGEPDGLNKVASDKGFDAKEKPHALAGTPTAGYAVKGIDDDRVGTGVAGVIGVAVVFVAGFGLFALVRRTRRAPRRAVGTGG